MSVLNDMLRNLEARGAAGSAGRIAAAARAPAPKADAARRQDASAPVEPAVASTEAGTPAASADAVPSISIATSSRSVAADVARAGELIARGRNSDAMPLLAQVLAREPTHAPARAALVALLAEGGQRERALALLLDGAQFDPSRFGAPAAQLLFELGDVAGALRTLERVPEARRTPAHNALGGGLAHRLGLHARAVDAYRHAVETPNAQSVWWVGLALAHEALGDHDAAQAAFGRASAQPTLPADVRAFVASRLQAGAAPRAATDVAAAP